MHSNVALPNNSVVLREEIGEGDKALGCQTLSDTQCGGISSPEIFFPNKTQVLPSGNGHTLYTTAETGVVYLNKRANDESPLGTYYCQFTNNQGNLSRIFIKIGMVVQFITS